MDKFLMLSFLVSQYSLDYNSENRNLSEEEKAYINYVDKCLIDTDERFCDACTRAMFYILESVNKMGTEEELTKEEIALQKEKILSGFSQEDKERLELFMYACIQTIGIYSEERNEETEKSLVKEIKKNKDNK